MILETPLEVAFLRLLHIDLKSFSAFERNLLKVLSVVLVKLSKALAKLPFPLMSLVAFLDSSATLEIALLNFLRLEVPLVLTLTL